MRVYFDASVVIAGLLSPSCGSRLLLELVQQGLIIGITSQTVVDEVVGNAVKIHQSLESIHNFIAESLILVRERLTDTETSWEINTVEQKDAHVIAGAIQSGCDFLVTLDKKHLLTPPLKGAVPNLHILSPADLLALMVNM